MLTIQHLLRTALLILCTSLISITAGAQSLVNGGSVSGSITSQGQQASYSLSAAVGENIRLRLADLNAAAFYPWVGLYDPSGSLVVSNANHNVAAIAAVATVSGTYQVIVKHGAGSQAIPSSPYRLHYTKAPGANSGGLLTNGGSVPGHIGLADLDSFTFTIRGGENFVLSLVDLGRTPLYPVIELFDPAGVRVSAKGAHDVAAISGVANQSGTYTVVVSDGTSGHDQTGNYEIHFVRLPGANEHGTLKNGAFISGRIRLGDLDSYTFAMQAGENYQLRLVDINAGSFYPVMSLHDPRGVSVSSRGAHTVTNMSGVAAYTGVYTIVIADGTSGRNQVGDYRVYFARIPGANEHGSLINGGAVNETIDLGDLDSYTFALQAGESFALRVVDLNGSSLYPVMSLYDPRGTLRRSVGAHDVAAINDVAPLSGIYSLIIADGTSGHDQRGTYEVHFVRLPGANTGGSLVNGGAISSTLKLGALDSYTFTIQAGESYLLRLTDLLRSSFYPTLSLYDPQGTVIGTAGAHSVAAIDGKAPLSGTYTVVVADGTSSHNQGGDYKLYFVRVPGANEGGSLREGLTIYDTIELGDLDSFTFAAAAGQTVKLTVTDSNAGILYPTLSLYDPTGKLCKSVGAHTNTVLNQAITTPGRYTVVVKDGTSSRNSTGPYSLSIEGSGNMAPIGCPGESTPEVQGSTSVSTGFTVTAASFQQNCTSPVVLMFGTCAATPTILPPGLGCGTCGLLIVPSWGSSLTQLVVPTLPTSAIGLSFCVQGGCISGTCINLSAGAQIVLTE